MTHLVPLSFIEANPWQPRHDPDPESVAELAENIKLYSKSRPDTFGLLQIPAGRLVSQTGDHLDSPPEDGNLGEWLMNQQACVQLAFGHRRLFAFRLLGYGALPVTLGDFSDQEMATMAWSENSARKDLNSVEEAMAIQRMIQDFSWTHEQASERLKLTRSTISNKLRLLKLPNPIQAALKNRTLSERQAMALVQLYDLPEQFRDRAENGYEMRLKPSSIVADALAGQASDRLRDRISSIISDLGRDLAGATWDLERIFDSGTVRAPACIGCEHRIEHNNKQICVLPKCFESKRTIIETERSQAHLEEIKAAQAQQAEQAPAEVPTTWPPENVTTQREETYPETSRPGLPLQEAADPAPIPVAAPQPEPAKPAPAPEPPPPPPVWEKAAITITITCYPENDFGVRMISLGGRAGQGAPLMRMLQGGDLLEDGPLADLLADLRQDYDAKLETAN